MSDRWLRPRRAVQTVVVTFGVLLAIAASALAAEVVTREVTFSRDVAPIFQAKCQECHQPNSMAPMSLITYEEARPWARAIPGPTDRPETGQSTPARRQPPDATPSTDDMEPGD